MKLFYFKPDSLSMVYVVVVTIVFACTLVYSFEYLKNDPKKRRFFISYGLTYLALILLSCA